MSKIPLLIVSAVAALCTVPDAHASAISSRPLYLGLDQGLVGYWSFEGKTVAGTRVHDASGNGNHGTMTNGPKLVNGKLGQGMEFDGSDDYVEVQDSASLDMLTDEMTFSLWAKFNTISTRKHILAKAQSGAAGWTLERETDNKLYLTRLQSSGGFQGTSATFTDTSSFHHIEVIFNRGIISIYYDGIKQALDAGNNVPSSLTTNNLSLRIGTDSGGENATDGLVDDVRIYNRALSPDGIKRLYKTGLWPIRLLTGSHGAIVQKPHAEIA